MRKTFLIYSLIVVGLIFSLNHYSSFHYQSILALFYYPLIAIFLCLFCYAIIINIEEYKTFKSHKSLTSTYIGIIIILINLGIHSHYKKKLEKPVLIAARNHGANFIFDESGSYVVNSGAYLETYSFYGNYHLNDSIITLDKKVFDAEILVTDRFVIRRITDPQSYLKTGKNKEYLIQIDQNGNEIINQVDIEFNPERYIHSSYKFEITKDKRK